MKKADCILACCPKCWAALEIPLENVRIRYVPIEVPPPPIQIPLPIVGEMSVTDGGEEEAQAA